MKDEKKTKKQLIAELDEMRQQRSVDRAADDIREAVLAMRRAEDLCRVIVAIRHGMEELGFDIIGCSIGFLDDDKELTRLYIAEVNPRKFGISWTSSDLIEVDEDTAVTVMETSISSSVIESIRKGEVSVNNTVYNSRGFAQQFGLERPMSLLADGTEMLNIVVPFTYPDGTGGIGMGSLDPLNEDQIAIVRRFAITLSLGYLRFIDFQRLEKQAEALKEQAEQARRERAVERVRSEAMAMRSTDDLLKVVGTMYQEMIGLDLVETRTQLRIWFFDDPTGSVISYFAFQNWRKFGISWTSPELMEFNEDVVVFVDRHKVADDPNSLLRWQEQQKTTYTHHEGAEYLEGNIERFGGDHIPPAYAEAYSGETTVTQIPFENGMIGVTHRHYREDRVAIIREFTEAVSLGFLRFLDFQKVDGAQKKLIDELEEELQTAHDLQMGLMPTESPQIDGFDIAGRCIPFNHVGGDFFQYFERDGKLAICMADVTGHAMEAAVPVMMFSGVLKTEMRFRTPIEQLFGHLNRSMHDSLDSRTYVCFCMGELEVATRLFRLANATCPYPFLFRASTGKLEEMQVDAYPLGIRAETDYMAIETDLEPGDIIVFCSDGIIEMGNEAEEIFGFERTAETIRQCCQKDLSAQGLIDRVIESVRDFAGEAPQGDDMTCVVVKVESWVIREAAWGFQESRRPTKKDSALFLLIQQSNYYGAKCWRTVICQVNACCCSD